MFEILRNAFPHKDNRFTEDFFTLEYFLKRFHNNQQWVNIETTAKGAAMMVINGIIDNCVLIIFHSDDNVMQCLFFFSFVCECLIL